MNQHATAPANASTADRPLPTLAVVGHPNKGKSSIVATLAENEQIAIAPDPGTTQTSDGYTVELEGRPLYTLVDTPGFERPRAALAWLNEHAATAADRAATVRRFVETHREGDRFAHECELLRPIIEGAGVLYVVDGSVPYGPEYEAEMQILRWTGQPRMALINPIGEADHIDAWRSGLRQYFDVVEVFDALDAPFAKRITLLEAFPALHADWKQPLGEAVDRLQQRRDRRRRESARAIAQMLADVVSMTAEKRLGPHAQTRPHEHALSQRFRDQLRKREQQGRREVEAVYLHHRLAREEQVFELLETDLFSTAHWYLWGLSRGRLAAMGAAGGAVLGGVIDAGVGGATFLLGSVIGGAVGGASAWLGADRIERMQVANLPLGGKRLICGPVQSANFAYVVLGRAIQHHALVAGRSHAARGPLRVKGEADAGRWIEALPPDQRRQLEKHFAQLRKSNAGPYITDELADKVEPLLHDQK